MTSLLIECRIDRKGEWNAAIHDQNFGEADGGIASEGQCPFLTGQSKPSP